MARSIASSLYGLARAARWARVVSQAAQGNPTPLLRRVRNREILRKMVGPILRK